ncbi:MAG: hypothetical protein LBK73_12215 [Treponema sp.]|jgi:hypothetical protein|nr:hypothetical protein [Treponema sp.]
MKPMIFSTPMVEALLNTKPGVWPAEPVDLKKPFKWQTRRVVKPQPVSLTPNDYSWRGDIQGPKVLSINLLKHAPCETGDILYVRERWSDFFMTGYIYRAGEECVSETFRWKPSIHMPRKAARLFLEVKNVRIEKLREITPEDKINEGVTDCCRAYPCDIDLMCDVPCFAKFWDSLNAKRGYGWGENPYVYVYEFMRLEPEEAQRKDAEI